MTTKGDTTSNWSGLRKRSPPGRVREKVAVGGPELGGSIFTALQEQLGLKLESQKGPAEKPAEN